ncbi:MAG: hypothetical protein ACXACA_00445 [Candidatus Ranarchaeia archaeon]
MSRKIWTVVALILFIAAAIFTFLGIMFILASSVQQTQARLTIGGIMLVVAAGSTIGGIIILRSKITHVVKATIELPEHVDLSTLRCRECGAPLDRKAVTYQPESGALFIKCPYCKSEYQMVEGPTW